MFLHTLLKQFDPAISLAGVADVALAGIAENSKLVERGDLFLARSGRDRDGAAYAAEAQGRGAAAVVCERPLPDITLPQVVLPGLNAAASRFANLLHGEPSRSVKVVGITGTNGKTTTAYLLRHLLAHLGRKCGMVGTVEIDDGRSRREASMTTPGAVETAGLLATMREGGCAACAMEVSSHALDQGRVGGVHFAAAGFTNLTGDHLDYHGTMERYAAAKAKLFESLDESAVAVLNAGDAHAARLTRDCRAKVIRFGFGDNADYQARDIVYSAGGTNFILVAPDGRTDVSLSLIGRHNVENALLAAALAGETWGLSVHQIAAGLRGAEGAPGRLQAVRAGQSFTVLVDYAHTDDALENVLNALRPLTRGKLRVLFGCGGDRDRTKRPRMARAAEKGADVLYLTSDNPRSEVPAAILEEIYAGLSAAGQAAAVVIEDRRAAVAQIIADADDGDVVLLTGKGHENYQIVGGARHHFDDVEEARRAIASCGAGRAVGV